MSDMCVYCDISYVNIDPHDVSRQLHGLRPATAELRRYVTELLFGREEDLFRVHVEEGADA